MEQPLINKIKNNKKKHLLMKEPLINKFINNKEKPFINGRYINK